VLHHTIDAGECELHWPGGLSLYWKAKQRHVHAAFLKATGATELNPFITKDAFCFADNTRLRYYDYIWSWVWSFLSIQPVALAVMCHAGTT
jgi:hypothetical protein